MGRGARGLLGLVVRGLRGARSDVLELLRLPWLLGAEVGGAATRGRALVASRAEGGRHHAVGQAVYCGDQGALGPGRPLPLGQWLRTLLPTLLTRGEEKGALGALVSRVELRSLTSSGQPQASRSGSGRAGVKAWTCLEVSKTVLLDFV